MFLLLVSPLLAAEVSGTLAGTVPAGEVVVEALDTTLRVVGETTAGADGHFVLSDLPALPVRLRAAPADSLDIPDRYYPDGDTLCEGALIVLDRGRLSAGHDIALALGGTLAGVLLTPDGEPAADAILTATPVADEPVTWERVAMTDADGAFWLSGLPTSADGTRVAISHDDWPQTRIGGYDVIDAETFVLVEGEVRDLGPLTLGQGVSLSGRVEDAAGDPVAAVDVRVRIGTQTVRAETAEDGTWAVQGLRAGDAAVWVASDGWAVHYWPGDDRLVEHLHLDEDGDVATDVVLIVSAETSLSGRIVGGPVGLEELSLKAVNDDGSVQITVAVDEDGSFTAHRLAAGDWSLLVRGVDLGGVEDPVRDDRGAVEIWRVAGGESVDVGEIPWVVEAVLEGRVVDPDGLPVHGATVTAHPDAADLPQLSVTTDDHGRYALPSLVAGPYRLQVTVAAPCTGDPDHVDVWWPEARVQAQAHVLHPIADHVQGGLDLVAPFDGDHDDMDDEWEQARGLDPLRDDGAEDPDGDGYSNLEEYQLGTNPLGAAADRGPLGGCGSPLSLSWLLLPLVGLGRREHDRS